MNSGIFGMTSGQSLAGRKVKLIGGNTAVALSGAPSSFALVARSTAVSGASTPVGVRTRLLSIADRGAIRALAIDGGGTDSTRVEVIVDGVTVWDRIVSTTSGFMYVAVGYGGGGASPVFVPDYVPFESSMELWVTRSALTTTNYAFTVDLHQ